MKKIFLILLSFTILSCNKDEDNKPILQETELGLVTGVNLLPETGPSPIMLGNPNIFIDKNIISIYPNPVVNILSMRSSYEITDVWVIPAEPNKVFQEVNFDNLLNSNTYQETKLKEKASIELNDNNSTAAHINFENLEPGYYRVFVKTSNTIMWDNILFIDNGELQDVFDYWD